MGEESGFKWTIGEGYVHGEVVLDRKVKDVKWGKITWTNKKGRLIGHQDVYDESGLEKYKIEVDCVVEKVDDGILIHDCRVLIPRPTVEEAREECVAEVEMSYPTEWLEKYGEHEKEKAIQKCIETKRDEYKAHKEYWETNIESKIETGE